MVDILAITAHPDDAEAGSGGFLLKAKKHGLTTGLIVCTGGESGGFASMETRVAEAEAGAEALKLDYFRLLDLPDAGIEVSKANQERLIPLVRECSPRIVITLHPEDYHPDHRAVSQLTEDVIFVAGLKKYSTDDTTWHPVHVLYFSGDMRTNRRRPDLIVPIDEVWDEKLRALNAYASQHPLGYKKYVVQATMQYGMLAGTTYAEGFYFKQPLVIPDIRALLP